MQLSSAQMFHHRWCAALAAGNVAAVRDLFHPDAVQVSSATGQVLSGVEQIAGALEQLIGVAGPIATSGVESFVDLGDAFCVESVQSTAYAQAFCYDVFVIDGGRIRFHATGSISPRALAPLPQPSGPTQGQDLYRRYWAATSAQDPNGLAAVFGPDLRFSNVGNVVYGRNEVIGAVQRFWGSGMGSALKTVSRFVETPQALCVEATADVGGRGGRLDLAYYEVWMLRQGQVSHLIRGLITPRPAELKQIMQKAADTNMRTLQDFTQATMLRNAMQVRW
ncbi:ketosteroid isomerase-like protein [Catenulispora sp. GP43]|uniref:nuclear transport factor 2 family protein n=1 Tax=Catenulispora sp. GP43 TaxID=3156263 RepID=UPI0035194700